MSEPTSGARVRRLALDPAFVRFLVSGGANTALGFVLFHSFFRLLGGRAGDAGRAQAMSYAIGIALSYGVNRRWTFRSEGAHSRHLPRFVTAHLCALALSSTLMALGVARLGAPASVWWVVVTGVTTVLNFAAQRRWVFAASGA